MQNSWLAASSFERMHEILIAINALSIHAKLILAGRPDPAGEVEVHTARNKLLNFLHQIRTLLLDAEADRGPVVGVDPGLAELAIQYLSRQQSHETSRLANLSFADLDRLVVSEQKDDLVALVDYLHDLRALLEQSTHSAVTGILGEG